MPDDYAEYEKQCEVKVKQEELDDLKMEIKEGMPEWLATIDRYDDPDIDDPDEIWGF